MGIIEVYLAIGIVVAIFLMIGLFSDDFDEMFEVVSDGMVLSTTWKVLITFVTVLIWPYTLYRMLNLLKEGDDN